MPVGRTKDAGWGHSECSSLCLGPSCSRITVECSVASRVLWKQVRTSTSASLGPWAYGVPPILTWCKDTSRPALLGTQTQ